MQGTPPFMAIDVLISRFPHSVAHDLESVFYVLLFICSHLKGPLGEIHDPPLYGNNNKNDDEKHPSNMRSWFNPTMTLEEIGHMKNSHIISYFDKGINSVLKNISPYFFPLKKYIEDFRKALFTDTQPATPRDVIKVFKAALIDDNLITAAKESRNSNIFRKRSHPGELVISPNSWDAVKPESTSRTSKKARLSPTTTRQTTLLTKGLKNAKDS
jgi:Fungal protein kinase